MNWLLLRGLAREARHFSSFPQILKEKTGADKILCLDTPGLGERYLEESPKSIAKIRESVAKEFKKHYRKNESWGILGQSLGGMIAMDWLALPKNPFKIGICVNTSANLLGQWPLGHRLKKNFLFPFLKSGFVPDSYEKEKAVWPLLSNKPYDEKILHEWAKYQSQYPLKISVFLSQMAAGGMFMAPRKIKTPIHFLCSKGDTLVDHSCSQRLAQHFNSPLAVHEWGGHDLVIDDPEWIALQISQINR